MDMELPSTPERLDKLRKELFALQDKFLEELCGDGENEETKLQLRFGSLVWEVDELIRAHHKKSLPF